MREPLRDIERLKHIQDAVNQLIDHSSQYTMETLVSNPIAYFGFVKLVEIIGEATYKLTKEFREQNPEIPWSVMEKMRHILVHDYYQISPEQVWKTVIEDIPELKPLIDDLVNRSELV